MGNAWEEGKRRGRAMRRKKGKREGHGERRVGLDAGWDERRSEQRGEEMSMRRCGRADDEGAGAMDAVEEQNCHGC
jgi:hypothetical protein